MNMNSQQALSTMDSADRSSASQSQNSTSPAIDKKKFDVLKVYENLEKVQNQSILSGGLDTGIEFGKFIIDTSLTTNAA